MCSQLGLCRGLGLLQLRPLAVVLKRRRCCCGRGAGCSCSRHRHQWRGHLQLPLEIGQQLRAAGLLLFLAAAGLGCGNNFLHALLGGGCGAYGAAAIVLSLIDQRGLVTQLIQLADIVLDLRKDRIAALVQARRSRGICGKESKTKKYSILSRCAGETLFPCLLKACYEIYSIPKRNLL